MSQDNFYSGSSNPFESPSQPAPPSGKRPASRPASASVFGALNIAFGILGICGIFGAAAQMMLPADMFQPPGAPENPVFTVMENSPGLKIFQTGSLIVGMVTTIMLIIAGINLLQDKRSGRVLSVYYSIITIITSIGGIIANFFLLTMPLIDMANSLPEGPEKAGAMVGGIVGFIAGCPSIIYPILLLIFMKREAVVTYYDNTGK